MSAVMRPLPLDTARTALRFGALVLLAVLAMVVYSAESASAHPRLVHSDPAVNAVLAQEPHSAVLTFNEDVVPSGTVVTVVGPSGTEATDGLPSVHGRQVVLPLRPGLPPGSFTISYRVVGGGQTATGRSTFTLLAPSSLPAHPSIS